MSDYLKNPLCLRNDLWGSGVWNLLHSLSFTYPDSPSPEFINKTLVFLTNLKLPCLECETNCVNYITLNPPTLNSRQEFVDWVINFRNSDRIFRGQTSFLKEDVVKYYKNNHDVRVIMNISNCSTCGN